jgi:hypothetical protein
VQCICDFGDFSLFAEPANQGLAVSLILFALMLEGIRPQDGYD